MILIGHSFWDPLLEFMKKNMEQNGYISPGDLDLVHVTDSSEEAASIVIDYVRRVGPPESRPKILG